MAGRAIVDWWPSFALFILGVAIVVPTVKRWLAGEPVSWGGWVVAGLAAAAALLVAVVWAERLWSSRRG
jgi:hypothetical protein